MSARGDALASQADSAGSATLNDVRDQLDALSEQFKQTSALLIPLSKEGVLLSQYRRNIGNWQDAVKGQYVNALKTLGVRIGVLAVLLAMVFAAAESVAPRGDALRPGHAAPLSVALAAPDRPLVPGGRHRRICICKRAGLDRDLRRPDHGRSRRRDAERARLHRRLFLS